MKKESKQPAPVKNRPRQWVLFAALAVIVIVSFVAGAWGRWAIGYEAGESAIRRRILEIVAERRVYLAPLKMDAPFQTVSNCIFIMVDPNDERSCIDMSEKVHDSQIENCVVLMGEDSFMPDKAIVNLAKSGRVCEVLGHRWEYTIDGEVYQWLVEEADGRRCTVCGRVHRRVYQEAVWTDWQPAGEGK